MPLTKIAFDASVTVADVGAGIGFGPFRLDPRAGLLQRDGQGIALRPKTWAVLLHLAERPGVLLSREELLDALWPGVAVTPDTLNKSIGELRLALGDDRHAPRFIETVHRRGFRFIAATRRLDAPAATAGRLSAASAHQELGSASRRERPFVGRTPELDKLAAAFARAQAGERQIVFVSGPAGVGKSALLDAFLDSPALRDSGAVWIGRADCFEHHGPHEAYMPVLEALERLARRPDAALLVRLMRRAAPSWLAQMPWLVAEAEVEALRLSQLGIAAERMPRELAALVETLAAERTLVLAFEDLHWSDPSTVDLLSLLAQRREPARLLVIGSYRPAELAVHEHGLASAVRTLRAQGQCAELPLHDLSEDDVRAYLAARFPGSDFPSALSRLIHAHTGGHPLFMAGIVDHMQSQGWILDTAPGWRLSKPPELMRLGVPDDLRHTIETEWRRLSPAEQRVLEAASLAGNQLTPPLLAAALGAELGGVEAHCEALARRQQFLRVGGAIESPDGSAARRYVFTHELYRQVVHEEIPEAQRARLHQRIGEALEAPYGARAVVEIAAQLAAHFQRGGDPARAVRYLTAAGARARRLGASREAIGNLEPALALIARLPDASERCRAELELRLAIGRALGDVHGFAAEPVRQNYERATELCGLAENPAALFEVLYARWYLHTQRAERDAALGLAEELGQLASRLGTVASGVLADSVLVRTALYDGRFTDVRRHMESLLARQRQPIDGSAPVAYGADPVIAATMHYAIGLWFLGDPAGAQSSARAGLAQARSGGDLFSLSAALTQAALVHLLSRDITEGSRLAAQAVALAAEQGFAFWKAMASTLSGWSRVQGGDALGGTTALVRTLAMMQATGTQFFRALVHAFLAEAHLHSGASASGLEQADAGLALTETTLDRSWAPELWRLKGELLLATPAAPGRRPSRARVTGKPTADAYPKRREGERCLVRALELSRAAQAKSLELRAATSLARLWRASGRVGKAHTLLADICGWFAADLTSPDLREARALLGELATAR